MGPGGQSARPKEAGPVRVLIVEDETRLADTVALGLRREGMAVDVAYDGIEGQERLMANAYDVVVLDRDLPGVHGDQICRELSSSKSPVRILILTASTGLEDKVEGLALGADDYLGKPFAFIELVARVRALARRLEARVGPKLEVDDIALDPAAHQVHRAGSQVELTRKEFAVLEYLLVARGAVVSSEELLEHVWDDSADPFSGVVRVVMSRLRQKLGPPNVIQTITGVGYRIPDGR